MAVPTKLPQPMRPSGFTGRLFGFAMQWLARSNYRWAIAQLEPVKPKSYLEIGFGTGRLAKMAAKRFRPARLCGVDPSELMFETAAKKLRRYGKKHALDLRLGDDTMLSDWPDGQFDAIVASHSFQFWSDPATTLARLRAHLSPSGRLVLVIRRHVSKGVMRWIPNPITKSGDELGGLCDALTAAGFRLLRVEKLPTGSQGFVAACA